MLRHQGSPLMTLQARKAHFRGKDKHFISISSQGNHFFGIIQKKMMVRNYFKDLMDLEDFMFFEVFFWKNRGKVFKSSY